MEMGTCFFPFSNGFVRNLKFVGTPVGFELHFHKIGETNRSSKYFYMCGLSYNYNELISNQGTYLKYFAILTLAEHIYIRKWEKSINIRMGGNPRLSILGEIPFFNLNFEMQNFFMILYSVPAFLNERTNRFYCYLIFIQILFSYRPYFRKN
jgi:hypothetical protein